MQPTKMELARLDLVEEDGPDTQPVAVLYEPGKIGLARARIPRPQAGEVRIKVCWAGICGYASLPGQGC
jgi:hypothetical protein